MKTINQKKIKKYILLPKDFAGQAKFGKFWMRVAKALGYKIVKPNQ